MTTVPEDPPPARGLLLVAAALLAGALALALPAALLGELAELLLLLEQAVTAVRPMTASAATPLVAVIRSVIWVSFRICWLFGLGLLAQASRGEQPGEAREQGQDDHGEDDDEERAAGDGAILAAVQAVDDEAAEAAEPDVRGDGGGGHDEDRRGAQADEDQRHRDRHLHPDHLLPAGHPDTSGGVPDGGIHPGDALGSVGEDGRDGQDDEGQQPGERREAKVD